MTRARLARALAIGWGLAAASCAGTPEAPSLPAGSGGISVRATVRPKAAMQAFAPDLAKSPGPGPAFEKIDYRRFDDMAVFIEGDALQADHGPAPAAATLVATAEGFDRQLVLAAPGRRTAISIVNRRSTPLTLFSVGETGDGFDERVEPGGSVVVRLADPGRYEIAAVEDEILHAEIVVAPGLHAAPARSGEPVHFFPLPPGEYRVTVVAARLLRHEERVVVRSGETSSLEVALGVDSLPAGR